MGIALYEPLEAEVKQQSHADSRDKEQHGHQYRPPGVDGSVAETDCNREHDNADNVVDNRRRQNDRTHFTLELTHFLQRFHGYAHARRSQNYADKHRVEHKRLVGSQRGKTAQKRHGEQKSAGNRHQHAAESNESRLQPRTFQLFYVGFEPCREQNQYYADFRDAF